MDILRMLKGLLTRAKIKSVNDTGDVQTVMLEGRHGETYSDVERQQPFGFTANPPAETEALLAKVGAVPGYPLALGGGSSSRTKGLASGESSHYDSHGHSVQLKSDRVFINGNGDILYLGADGLPVVNGVVIGTGIDPFTGVTYHALGNFSATTRASS